MDTATAMVSVAIEGKQIGLVRYPAFETAGRVRAAFTTKRGGVSTGPYAELNLGWSTGDDPARIRENYRLAALAFGSDFSKMVLTQQTHTTNVMVVAGADAGRGTVRDRGYMDIDGAVTDEPGIVLVTHHADCTPLYFSDPEHHAIGLAHSGWKGTVGRIGAEVLRVMHETYGTDPGSVFAAIGPTIGIDRYEIGPEVGEQFERAFGKNTLRSRRIMRPGRGDRLMLGLMEANLLVMEEAGIRRDHISLANICTYYNSDLFYSHRKAAGGPRGTCAALLTLADG